MATLYRTNLIQQMSQITYLFHDGGPYHIETSPLICSALSVNRNRLM